MSGGSSVYTAICKTKGRLCHGCGCVSANSFGDLVKIDGVLKVEEHR